MPSWDRGGDGGGRPLSSATAAEANNINSSTIDVDAAGHGSRPSSAAFRCWMNARPSARSAISAVSSARTLGMDDPELVHLQLEMESRRGGMSESTLARVGYSVDGWMGLWECFFRHIYFAVVVHLK